MRGRFLLAAVVLAALPLYLVIDLAVAFRGGWWTSSSMWQAVLALSTAVLTVTALLLLTRRGRAALARNAAVIVLGVGSLVLSGAAAEAVVHAAVQPSSWFHRYVPGHQQIFTPFPEYMPGVSGEARHTANALGLRGPELPARESTYRILCVGGSTTACSFLDDRETWPWLLGERLREAGGDVWVADVGRSGYGTWHHVRLLEERDLIEQMDCLLFLVGINDFLRALQGRSLRSPLGVRPAWERSAIFTVLHNAYQVRKQRKEHREETTTGDIYVERRNGRQRLQQQDELPDLTAGLAEYRANLETLIRGCRELGVTPLFATQPVLYRDGLNPAAEALLWLGGLPNGKTLSAGALRRGMDLFNDELRAVCAEQGVGCLELSPLSGRAELYYDGCHFNEGGAAAVAERLAQEWPGHGPELHGRRHGG